MSSGRDWSAVIDVLIGQLSAYYVDAVVAEQVIQTLRQRHSDGAYAHLIDDESFAAGVSRDTVAASSDAHLQLRYGLAPRSYSIPRSSRSQAAIPRTRPLLDTGSPGRSGCPAISDWSRSGSSTRPGSPVMLRLRP